MKRYSDCPQVLREFLIYNENIVIRHVVKLTAYEKVFSARQTEKYFTAVMYMYIGVGIGGFRIISRKAFVCSC